MSKNNRARRKSKQLAKWKREKQLRVAQNSAERLLSETIPTTTQQFKSAHDHSVLLSEWKITWEKTHKSDRTPEVSELAQRAYEHIECDELERAIDLLRKAVQLEPDGADLWNNLADALSKSDHPSEANRIAKMLRERFPDYFFGIIREATNAIDDGDLELARTLLDQAQNRRHLHITEFRAIVTSEIELANQSRHAEAAKAWLDIWKSVERHPAQEVIARHIEIHENPWRFLSSWLPRN